MARAILDDCVWTLLVLRRETTVSIGSAARAFSLILFIPVDSSRVPESRNHTATVGLPNRIPISEGTLSTITTTVPSSINVTHVSLARILRDRRMRSRRSPPLSPDFAPSFWSAVYTIRLLWKKIIDFISTNEFVRETPSSP